MKESQQLTTTPETSKQTDIIVVPLDSSDIPGSDTPGAHPSAILDYSRKGWEGPDPIRSTLLKFIAPAMPGADASGIKQYLAVVCFSLSHSAFIHGFVGLEGEIETNGNEKQHEVEADTEATVKPEMQTVRYKLLEKFGA